jgi:dTDP-4-dehydrorhamnose reductase
MKFLIVGADGQLGKEWVHILSNRGENFSAHEFNDLDITNFEKLEEVVGIENPDVLINCAAYTAVDKAEEEVDLADLINNIAVKKIAQICKVNNIKLLHYSTDYVFSGTESHKNTYPNGYPETANPSPVNAYGLSKLKGEQAILNSNCDFLIIRLSWLCGLFGNNFVKTMLKLSQTKDDLTIINDQFGAPTFTNQVVYNSLELIYAAKTGIYHLGSSGITTWFDFAKAIFEIKNIDITIHPISSSGYPTPAKRPHFSKLCTQKITKELNIHPQPWKHGLTNLLKYLE